MLKLNMDHLGEQKIVCSLWEQRTVSPGIQHQSPGVNPESSVIYFYLRNIYHKSKPGALWAHDVENKRNSRSSTVMCTLSNNNNIFPYSYHYRQYIIIVTVRRCKLTRHVQRAKRNTYSYQLDVIYIIYTTEKSDKGKRRRKKNTTRHDNKHSHKYMVERNT